MAWWNSKTQAGLSLLGTLLAAFLLATTAVAVSHLVARTQRASASSRERIIATAIGREGLELVRAVRDTNWFLQPSDARPWTFGLCSDMNGNEFFEKREFTLDAKTVRQLDPVGDGESAQLYVAGNGEWIHESTSHATPYQRLLSVDCSDKDVSMLVSAQVTWPGRDGNDRQWTVRERLYDWLP